MLDQIEKLKNKAIENSSKELECIQFVEEIIKLRNGSFEGEDEKIQDLLKNLNDMQSQRASELQYLHFLISLLHKIYVMKSNG